jgi:purine catabolism regulator
MWRSFDVGSVVKSLAFSEAFVAAGEAGMARRVSRARLAATTDDLRRSGSAELIVTTATTLLGAEAAPDQLIARLDGAQVAGLAIRMDGPDELPGSLLDMATALALPVVTFPAGTPLADAAAAVLDALLEAQRQRLDRVLDIHQRFTRVVVAGGGIPEIAATLHEVLGVPLAVLDGEGRTLVVVPSDAVPESDLGEGGAAREAISAGDESYGEIVVLSSSPLGEDGVIAMQRAAMGMAVRQAQAHAVAVAEERFAALTLEELVAGRAGDAAAVAERAASFGWDLGRPRAVLLASVDPPEEGEIPPGALNTIAAAARATLGGEAIVWTRSATIAALLAPDSALPSERREIAERLRKELDARLRTVTVSIGVGHCVDQPSELPRSFSEATTAVDVGRWAKGRHVTEVYDELGLERLLASTPPGDLAEFVEHAIGPLVEHDRVHGADLVETLGVWLATRNMAEAARQMFVHYNTLKNRLERIESIVGPVLGDAARALECEVALYIFRHYDGPWTQAARGS